MQGKVEELPFIKLTLHLSLSFRRQNIASTKNSQTFLESQVSVLRRNIATNSCTSNHHFSAAFKAFVLGKFIQAFLDLTSHAHGKSAAQG